MFRTMSIAFAFIGAIVGAGFASGQEIMQYFNSFGYWGLGGAIVATVLFAYIGYMMLKMGSRLQATSHHDAIYKLGGKFLGTIIDYILVFTFFGVGVVMIAGAGSMLNQQYAAPEWIGSLIMTVLIVATIIMPIERVILFIGAITPFLIIALIVIVIYSLYSNHASLAELEPIALTIKSSLPNWLVSGINYVAFNVSVAAGIAIVIGGSEKNEKIAGMGGLVGGLGVGILIVIAYFAIFFKIADVSSAGLPLLSIIQDLSPALGILMTVVLFGMIYNTGVAEFYAFVARFNTMGTKKAYIFAILTGVAGFILSFVGFIDLVAYFYPLIGYLGLLLIVILIIAPFRHKKAL